MRTSNPILAERSMGMDRFTLRFESSDVEREYRLDHASASRPYLRNTLLLAILLYTGFGVLDPAILGDAAPVAWFIRYVLMLPFALVLLYLSARPVFPRIHQPALALLGFTSAAGHTAMMVASRAPERDLYYAGLLLISVYVYTFLRLRFAVATPVAWAVAALYLVTVPLGSTAPVVLVSNSVFLICTNVVGMGAAYMMERSARHAFLQRRVIAAQAQSLGEALASVKVLSGLLPICAWCHKVRDDRGYWRQLEAYLAARTDASFSHGICPDCETRVDGAVAPEGGAPEEAAPREHARVT